MSQTSEKSLVGPLLASLLGLGVAGWGTALIVVVVANWDRIQHDRDQVNFALGGGAALILGGVFVLQSGLKRIAVRMKK
ncbi:MAG: hypothetical protein IT359_10060 [Gemmatimonadaceae bacterium]|nr:hypothetical protein [Gemmatimonadaceae bacterium]